MEKWESETGDVRKDGVADKLFDKSLKRVERRWKLATVEVTVATLGIPSHRITVQGKSGCGVRIYFLFFIFFSIFFFCNLIRR